VKGQVVTDTSANVSVSAIGFPGLLTLLFIGLKLAGVISWSWLWVLSPLWLGIALTAGFVLLIVASALIGTLIEERRRKRTRLR
jgi:energy-coupling factor transporter transmembrane protein EcfT